MIALATDVIWGSQPQIKISFYYEKVRDGANMKYRTQTVISPLTGSAYFGFYINQKISMDGTQKEDTQLKANSPSQWSNAITYTSPWYTIENKVSGTTSVRFILYTNSGRSNLDVSYSMDIDPAYPVVSQSLNSKTVNSIKMNWSSDSTIDYIWYSKDDGVNWTAVSSVNATSGSYTISNLTPNTLYKIKTRLRRKDSQLSADTSKLEVTTYDIARITTFNNFNHGVNPTLVISNPGAYQIEVTAQAEGETIYGMRTWTISTGATTGFEWTPNFSDEEWDIIYKSYGSSNTTSLKFFVWITCNNVDYSDYKSATCTLTGDQKTMYTKVSNSWKRAKTHYKVNGTWKKAVIWTKVNGTWVRGI